MIDTLAYIKRFVNAQHDDIDQMFGDDNCLGWTMDGPPCGGCHHCGHAMVAHYNEKWFKLDHAAKAVGLKGCLPDLIDCTFVTYPSYGSTTLLDYRTGEPVPLHTRRFLGFNSHTGLHPVPNPDWIDPRGDAS